MQFMNDETAFVSLGLFLLARNWPPDWCARSDFSSSFCCSRPAAPLRRPTSG